MWTRPEVSSEPMTVELAERFAKMTHVPGERSLNRHRLAYLRREIESKTVTAFRLAYAVVNGVEVRVNGQHTAAIFQSGDVEPYGTASIEKYVCDSMEDAISLWCRFDSQKSSRTKSERLSTFFESDSRFKDIPKRKMMLGTSAVCLRCYGFGYANKITDEQKWMAVQEYADFILWAWGRFPSPSNSNGFLLRVGAWYPALVMWEIDAKKADVFWEEVITGSNPDPKSGSRVLRETLIRHDTKTGAGSRSGRKTLAWDQQSDLALTAWRSWKANRQVVNLKLHKDGVYAVAPKPRFPVDNGD